MDGGQVNSLGVKDLVPKVLVADLFVFGGLYTSSSVSPSLLRSPDGDQWV